jgi:hypothetical protein
MHAIGPLVPQLRRRAPHSDVNTPFVAHSLGPGMHAIGPLVPQLRRRAPHSDVNTPFVAHSLGPGSLPVLTGSRSVAAPPVRTKPVGPPGDGLLKHGRERSARMLWPWPELPVADFSRLTRSGLARHAGAWRCRSAQAIACVGGCGRRARLRRGSGWQRNSGRCIARAQAGLAASCQACHGCCRDRGLRDGFATTRACALCLRPSPCPHHRRRRRRRLLLSHSEPIPHVHIASANATAWHPHTAVHATAWGLRRARAHAAFSAC